MEEYVIAIGNFGFLTWWQVIFAACLVGMYILLNVIPAIMVLYMELRKKKFFEAPLLFAFMLIPLLGTIAGVTVLDEKKWAYYTFLSLAYLIIISIVILIL